MFKFISKFWELYWYGKKRPGLIEETDERNLGSRNLIPISKNDLVDESFVVFDPTSIDQYDSDFCVGEGGGYVAEATENRVNSGAYLFALAKKVIGAPVSTWGTSILAVCKARQKYGVCERGLWPTLRRVRDYCADWRNIPQKAHDDAFEHRSEAFCEVNTPFGWSRFDAIRATLWAGREMKVLIQTGNNSHNITVIGYIGSRVTTEFADKHLEIAKIAIQEGYTDCLVCKDTYGKRTYHQGYRFVNRQEGRTLFTPYTQLDIEVSLAKLLDKYNGKGIYLPGSKDIYVVWNGERRLLKNEFVMWSFGILGYPEPKDIFEIPVSEFEKIPEGKPVEWFEGPANKFAYQLASRIIAMKPGNVEDLINME